MVLSAIDELFNTFNIFCNLPRTLIVQWGGEFYLFYIFICISVSLTFCQHSRLSSSFRISGNTIKFYSESVLILFYCFILKYSPVPDPLILEGGSRRICMHMRQLIVQSKRSRLTSGKGKTLTPVQRARKRKQLKEI